MGRLRKNSEYEARLFADTNYYVANPFQHKGKWNELFKNNNPIQVEIGTGKGRFIFEKALKHPEINFIAIDKFATVLYKLLYKLNTLQQPIKNIKILAFDVCKIENIFENKEIDKIFLNFSDPWPKQHHERFRLTSNFYTSKFFDILKDKGFIEFKTDNENLFNYTINKIRDNKYKVFYALNDLYNSSYVKNNIQTEYEQKWLAQGVKIKKVVFSR